MNVAILHVLVIVACCLMGVDVAVTENKKVKSGKDSRIKKGIYLFLAVSMVILASYMAKKSINLNWLGLFFWLDIFASSSFVIYAIAFISSEDKLKQKIWQ
jgi:hypothetical protein